MTTWTKVDDLAETRAVEDPVRLDGAHPTDGLTIAEPVTEPRLDFSACPRDLPWLPWQDLAAQTATGDEDLAAIAAREHLTAHVRGRARSLGQVTALRLWRDRSLTEVMLRVREAVARGEAGTAVAA